MNRRDCEFLIRFGICELLNCSCDDVEDEDCPVTVDLYDPYFNGDCEEF